MTNGDCNLISGLLLTPVFSKAFFAILHERKKLNNTVYWPLLVSYLTMFIRSCLTKIKARCIINQDITIFTSYFLHNAHPYSWMSFDCSSFASLAGLPYRLVLKKPVIVLVASRARDGEALRLTKREETWFKSISRSSDFRFPRDRQDQASRVGDVQSIREKNDFWALWDFDWAIIADIIWIFHLKKALDV